MWVIITKAYAGPLGIFIGGQKYDVPKPTIEQLRKELGKEHVIDTCAPWDEHKDHKAVAAVELKTKAETAIKQVEQMQTEMIELRKVAAQINILKKELDNAIPKAERLAKQAGIKWTAKTKKGD
jgi:hypothetical protein